MSDAKPCNCPPKRGLSLMEWIIGGLTGALAVYVVFRPTPATPTLPAGQTLPDLSGLIGGQAGVDRVAQQLGATIAPILQNDTTFQRNIGVAVGQEVGKQFRIPVYIAATGLLLGGGALVYRAVK